MARIRTIKPEFFVSAQVADVSPTCRLLFVGMWLFCDDAGIHPASPKQLKMEVFPGDDVSVADVRAMIDELIRVGLVLEYDVDVDLQVRTYWQVTGWHHQKIERPRCQYPPPDSPTCRRHIDDTSPTPRPLTVPETTVPEGKGPEPSSPSPTNGEPPKTKRRTKSHTYSPEFQAWWAVYPAEGRSKKPDAFARWREEVTPDIIDIVMDATREYTTCGKVKAGFIRLATTWLHGRAWEDDRASWQASNGARESKPGPIPVDEYKAERERRLAKTKKLYEDSQ